MTRKDIVDPPKLPEVALKRCAFCGEGRRLDSAGTIDAKLVESVWIYCRHCGASGPTSRTLAEAGNRWNQRL